MECQEKYKPLTEEDALELVEKIKKEFDVAEIEIVPIQPSRVP